LDVAPAERCKEYYMGEGGGFPLIPTPKGVSEYVLTLLWLVLGADSSLII